MRGRDPERAEPHHPAPRDRAGASWTSSAPAPRRSRPSRRPRRRRSRRRRRRPRPASRAGRRAPASALPRASRSGRSRPASSSRHARSRSGSSVMPRALTQVTSGRSRTSVRITVVFPQPGGPTRLIQRSESRAAGRTDSTSSRPITRLSTQAILPRARRDRRAGPGSGDCAGVAAPGVRSRLGRTTDAAAGRCRALLVVAKRTDRGTARMAELHHVGGGSRDRRPRRAVAADARRHAGDGSGHFGRCWPA